MLGLGSVNLATLRAVEAVARLGSLRAAADELSVTPGAVSQQIIKAEAQLGRTLFDRTPKGMQPTKIGLDVAALLTEGFQALARGVALTQSGREDAITVSVAPVFAAKWLVRRLGRFSESHPAVRVRIDASVARIQPQPGDVDACIRVGRGNWAGVRAEELLPQRAFPVCAPVMADRVRHLEDLTKVPIIREQTNTLVAWDTWLAPNGLGEAVLGDGPVFSDASLCLDAAAAGQGVFLSMETMASDALSMGHLVAPLPGRFPTGVSYWFVEPEGLRRPAPVKAFRDWLLDEMRGRT